MGLSGMQQGGAMAYEQMRAGQPGQGWGDMLMGLGIGAGQSKMMGQLGQKPGATASQRPAPDYSSMFQNQQTPQQWYQQNGYGNTPRWG